MKHTIKLLTLAFMLATILTLTGCPGPVNNYIEPVHEHVFGDWSDWEVVTAATCTKDGSKKRTRTCSCGEIEEETAVIAINPNNHDFGEWSNWDETKKVAYDHDGEKEHTHTCTRCRHSETEKVTVSRFVAGGYDGTIPAEIGNPETYRYQYEGENDYQIKLNIYANKGDNAPIKTLYFSFDADNLTSYSYIEIAEDGNWIRLDDLIQLKTEFQNYKVAYETVYCPDWGEYNNYQRKLSELEGNPRSVILTPITN